MFQLSDKQIRILKTIFHVAFVVIISFQLIEKVVQRLPDEWLFFLTSDALEYFVFTAIAYLLYYKIFKDNKLWVKTILLAFLIVVIGLLAILKSYRIHNEIVTDRSFDFFTEFVGKTFLFYMLIYFVNRLDFFNRYKKLENELHQAKSRLLKHQLHPHFLFNAFNSLYSLALKNSPETPETILKLSGMMRYLTDDSINKQVKLEHELKFINQYIAIEKIRFGDQANITFQVKGNQEGKTIEPLLLITLVENAFKHGFYTNDSSAFINIDMTIDKHSIVFKVENSIQSQQHFNATNREGKGLENLKKRLQLSYPKKHKLVLQNKRNVYIAKLEINLI